MSWRLATWTKSWWRSPLQQPVGAIPRPTLQIKVEQIAKAFGGVEREIVFGVQGRFNGKESAQAVVVCEAIEIEVIKEFLDLQNRS